MMIVKRNNVYDVYKWNQIKSYTDFNINTPFSIPDTFYGHSKD